MGNMDVIFNEKKEYKDKMTIKFESACLEVKKLEMI